MTRSVRSRGGVLVRLTDERWGHIAEEHAELAGMHGEVLRTITEAEYVLAGGGGELLAVREVEPGKVMVVVYREGDGDGFVITAFLTRQVAKLNRRIRVWPPKN